MKLCQHPAQRQNNDDKNHPYTPPFISCQVFQACVVFSFIGLKGCSKTNDLLQRKVKGLKILRMSSSPDLHGLVWSCWHNSIVTGRRCVSEPGAGCLFLHQRLLLQSWKPNYLWPLGDDYLVKPRKQSGASHLKIRVILVWDSQSSSWTQRCRFMVFPDLVSWDQP